MIRIRSFVCVAFLAGCINPGDPRPESRLRSTCLQFCSLWLEWKSDRSDKAIDADVEQAADICFSEAWKTRREAARRKVLETDKVTGITFDIVKQTDEGEGGTSLVVVEKGFSSSSQYTQKPYTMKYRFLFKKVGEDWLMSAAYAACRACAAAGSCFNCEGSGREVCP